MPDLSNLGSRYREFSPEDARTLDALKLRLHMLEQMKEAQDISDAVPRGFKWQPPPLPELPTQYRPPQYWNYGQPVRVG